MKTLPIQHLRDYDFADMERQLKDIFYTILFKPALDVIESFNPAARRAVVQIRNAAEDALREALSTGRVQYQNGVFSGEFSAAIAGTLRDIGAKFYKREKVYRMDVGRVPAWVKAEATTYQSKAKSAHMVLKQKLDEIQRDLDLSVKKHAVDSWETIARVEEGFAGVGQRLAVNPELSSEAKERLADAYSENMKIWIKKFSASSILSLREAVEKNAQEGYRFDKLIGGIKRRYGVTTNKAKFLARQETGLFMANYRRERFQEAGVRKYKWSTSHDARVRHDHRHLDGRVFTYDNPPVVDTATGRKANPGQDYNCRCVDMPVLEAVYA